MNLGVDPRHADQMVRGVVTLPNGTGKIVRVAVFARGDKADEATKAGADIVGAEDLVEIVQGGKIDFDRCIATPDMMPLVGRLGKVLGSAQPDAEPEGRHGDHGCRRPRSRPRRAARSSSASKRPGSSMPASARPRSTRGSWSRTSAPSSRRWPRPSPPGAKGTYMKKVSRVLDHGPRRVDRPRRLPPATRECEFPRAFRGAGERRGGDIPSCPRRRVNPNGLLISFPRRENETWFGRGDALRAIWPSGPVTTDPNRRVEPAANMSRRGKPFHTWSETVDRAQKEKVVEELGQIFESSGVVVVAHYAGLTVAEMQDLRARMREAGGSVRVAKNKLAKIALDGKPGQVMTELLKGMTVLAYSEDPVTAAPRLRTSSPRTTTKFVILGGAMGETFLDTAGVKAVADDAVAGRASGSDRVVHRGACRKPRRSHWRTCFVDRGHPFHHRGTGCRLSN